MSIYNNVTDHPFPLYIDSSERTSGTNSSFQSKPADLSTGNKYDSVVVSQVSIPKSWYNVPNNFRTFTLSEGGALSTVTIPAGNYNRLTLANVLPALLTAASTVGKTYTMTYPDVTTVADTGKFTFSYTPVVVGDDIKFIFDDSSMFQQLGFGQSSTNTFTAGSLVSTNVINFQIISSIFITSDMCVEEGVLQEVHNVGATPSNAYIFYQQIDYDITSKQLLTNTSNSWNFTLIDEYEREIDLNGVAWEMSLILYNRSDYHQLAREDIRIRNIERLLKNERLINNNEETTQR
jgi:hypothetical protein